MFWLVWKGLNPQKSMGQNSITVTHQVRYKAARAAKTIFHSQAHHKSFKLFNLIVFPSKLIRDKIGAKANGTYLHFYSALRSKIDPNLILSLN